eukprot:TRINITY_DN3494_c0_g1_i1.p1 TRINITY_DN3494_c0_g1~~TRINITY_DN3494_c0_g1_i1.p1  ORF type:complete len:164 (-),score=43.11 TRINITY_DN3494_c0_g1_i1:86-577(-)
MSGEGIEIVELSQGTVTVDTGPDGNQYGNPRNPHIVAHIISNEDDFNDFVDRVPKKVVGMYKVAPESKDPILKMTVENDLKFDELGTCLAVTTNDMYNSPVVENVAFDESNLVLTVQVLIKDPGERSHMLQRRGNTGRYKFLRLVGANIRADSQVVLEVRKEF